MEISSLATPKRSVRLSITQKLIVGFAAMAFFTLAALALSLLGLLSINGTARQIAQADLPVINSLAKLRSAVLAQEGYAGRYAIFKSPEFAGLFRQREQESLSILALLVNSDAESEAAQLKVLYHAYSQSAGELFAGRSSTTEKLRAGAGKLLDAVDNLSRHRQNQLQEKLAGADYQQRFTVRWTLIISFTGFLLALLVAVFSTWRISGAIRKLRNATQRIAQGEFDFDPQIPSGDEIGDLAQDFSAMAVRLKALEQLSLDASPLTRLPGNVAIEQEIERRLASGNRFAFCYADLDNFKAYGDHYGYAKGSELIRLSGDIIYTTVRDLVAEEGFVGHIGGDDFVMILPEEAAGRACEEVIAQVDRAVAQHYHPEDLARGGIDGIDRYGVQRFFPLVSISIAVVVCSSRDISSAVELAQVSAELKDYVKESPGSSYSIKHYREDA